MKKKSLFIIAITAMLAAMVGCKENDTQESAIDVNALKDQFAFKDRVKNIKSAIYEQDQTDSSYTFWFSPTGNIQDREGMEIADDYIRITAPERPHGTLDLTADGYELAYGNMVINAYTYHNYSDVQVSVDLNSAKTVKFNASAVSPKGEQLNAKYYNLCYPVGYVPGGSSEENNPAEAIVMDRTIYQYYFGFSDAGTRNYYIVATNSDYTIGNTIKLDNPGYILILDLYCDNDGNIHNIPTGTFREDDAKSDHSYASRTSGVIYYDENMSPSSYYVEHETEIVENPDGTITVTAHFYDDNDDLRTFTYTSKNKFASYTGNFYNPQIDDDVHIEGFNSAASYQGNVFETATGLMQINVVDEEYSTSPDGVAGGYGISLVYYSDLFGNPKDCRIIPGHYTTPQKFGQWGTWMPAQEVNYMGFIIPLGTYVHYNDGGYGKFMYLATGTIDIEESPLGWKLDWDLYSAADYHVTGSYEGPIPVTDDSNDKGKDDGTSTLERDYEMDLEYIQSATLYTYDDVYIKRMGFRPGSRWGVGAQHIAIGKRSGTMMSDVCWLEFLTVPGDELYVNPGEYPIADNNYPDAYFKPGVACAGTILNPEDRGCWWKHFYQVGDYPEGYIDGHAYFYGGVINVSYDEETGNYTFDIDGICVREHHVTDTWTGPIYTAGGQKVTPSPNYKEEETESAKTQSFRPLSIPAKDLAPYFKMLPASKITLSR